MGRGRGGAVIHNNTQSVSSSTRKQEVAPPSVGAGWRETTRSEMKEGWPPSVLLLPFELWVFVGRRQGEGQRRRGGRSSRGTRYSGQAGRDRHEAEEGESGVRARQGRGVENGAGDPGVRGQASYLDRVLSAKCFCWLSACLPKTTTPLSDENKQQQSCK